MESDFGGGAAFTNWNSIRPTTQTQEAKETFLLESMWTLRAICQGEENTKAGAKKL